MAILGQPLLPIRYLLEIYDGPNSCLMSFESSGPFMTISPGHIINTDAQEITGEVDSGQLMVVIRVEHLIWTTKTAGHIGHKLMVYVQPFEE